MQVNDIKTAELVLVKQARGGDVEAFETLYRCYNDRIYNFVRQVVASEADAADVAQETFVRAWRSLPKLRDDSAFGGWLYRIALNQSKEALSRKSRGSEVSFDDEALGEVQWQPTASADDPESAAVKAEASAILRKAMAELSPEHRAAVAMHHLEGLDVTEVAKHLCVPPGTIMSRLARARTVLRRKLESYLGTEQL